MTWHLRIQNVAGIRDGEATIEPGINAVRASNWRGKSSLIAAIETAVGMGAPLTEGQDRGWVELSTDGSEVSVTLVRQDGSAVRQGGDYLEDELDRRCAELFAFLDDSNEIRRAVRNGENLESLLTEPLDLEDIDEQLSDLSYEREQVESELERAKQAADKLPRVEERIVNLESQLEELSEREAELAGEETAETGGSREELSDARAARERTRDRIDRLEETVSKTKTKLDERHQELDALTVPDETDIATELADIRSDLQEIERDVELLRSVYEANSRILEEDRVELVSEVEHGLAEDLVECWICGSSADRNSFTDRLADLRERIASKQSEATEYEKEVESLEKRREESDQARRKKADLKAAIADLESTLVDREESLDAARDRLEELEASVEELTGTLEERDEELTDVRSERKYVENELEDLREERSTLESRAARRDALAEEIENLSEEIVQLRERKETVKRELREAFSKSMGDIIERFGVSFESARLTGNFDIVVARDGREASIEALSEGEVELLGIVAALAGHQAYEVNRRLPISLLDGIGGLAGDNLNDLVEYMTGRAKYLVLTAYPEYDSFEANEIDPSRWTVVSDQNGDTAA